MKRSGVHGKSLPQVSASRRDASVVDAMSCTIESSLRDSIIIYHCQSGHSASLHNRLLSARPDGLREETSTETLPILSARMYGRAFGAYKEESQEVGLHIIHRKAMSVQLDTFFSPPCRDAPLVRIRRMPQEVGLHIIHRKAMSVQIDTFVSSPIYGAFGTYKEAMGQERKNSPARSRRRAVRIDSKVGCSLSEIILKT